MFPDAFESYFESSIIGRAKEKSLFEVFFYKINDFSTKKFKQADDKAYGMHGQVISPEPVSKAIEFVFEKLGKKIPIIFMTPRGKVLTQEQVEKFYQSSSEYIILCGHYEGIDQRIIDLYVDYEVSIGEYVLSSGELSALVLVDSLIRHIP
jgi:tRNA (guanine37-N1)-methyltransferase